MEQEGFEKTLLKNQRLTFNEDGHVLLANLLDNITELCDFDFSKQIVKYYSASDKMFVVAGKYPLPEDIFIEKSDLDPVEPL